MSSSPGKASFWSPSTTVADEQDWFGTFRLGIWPDFFPGVQFSRDPEALNQFFRQMTPDTGPLDPALNSNAVIALFEKIGPGILVTHSHSGGMGWRVRLAMAKLWRGAVNRWGGDVTVGHLPKIGILGNTHFPMSDTNNLQIADQMSKFLAQKKLD